METILYFYIAEQEKLGEEGRFQPRLERSWEKRYCLVRVGICQKGLERMEEDYRVILSAQDETVSFSGEGKGRDALKSEQKKAKRQPKGQRKRQAKKQKEQKERERRLCLERLDRSMSSLAEIIRPLVDFPNECSYVYAEGLKKYIFTKVWQNYCSFVELREEAYRQSPWVEELLAFTEYDHYIILGVSPALIRPLWQRAVRMKSLKWFAIGKQFGEELQEFVEELSQEYGLIAELHLLEGEDGYQKIRLQSALPVNVLDFSGESRLKLSGLPAGSCLLDMCAIREKRKQLEERGLPIRYFSMKKLWEQWQTAVSALDTTNKNGYNTFGNRGILETPEREQMILTEKPVSLSQKAGS